MVSIWHRTGRGGVLFATSREERMWRHNKISQGTFLSQSRVVLKSTSQARELEDAIIYVVKRDGVIDLSSVIKFQERKCQRIDKSPI